MKVFLLVLLSAGFIYAQGTSGPRSTTLSKENITAIDGVKYPQTGEGIQAAINALPAGGGTIFLPPGTYPVSTTLKAVNGLKLIGAGRLATILSWTGSNSGTLLSGFSINALKIQSLEITTSAGGGAIGISIAACKFTTLDDLLITGGAPTTGFGTPIHITGDSISTPSWNTKISKTYIQSFVISGLAVDHAAGTDLSDVSIYPTQDNSNVTANDIVLDSGLSGFNGQTVDVGNGLHGLLVKNTGGGAAGTYNGSPWAIFCDQCQFDSLGGGDGVVFDPTLDTNVVSAFFTNSWIASASGVGLHITGGQKIDWGGGQIRANSMSGVLIDSAKVSNVSIHDGAITSNNSSNNPDGHGIYVSAAASNISVSNVRIGNALEFFTVGHQKYGVKISSNADQLKVESNDLNDNETGPYSTADTASQYFLWNRPFTAANITNGLNQWSLIPGPGGWEITNSAHTQANISGDDRGQVSVRGNFTAAGYRTPANCSSKGSPAVCGLASAGSVIIAPSASSVVVETTAVTASSEILVTFDSSLGAKLSVMCNTAAQQPYVTARSAGSSFTISTARSFTTNPGCFSYQIIN